MSKLTKERAAEHPLIVEAIRRSLLRFEGDRVIYNLKKPVSYHWSDREEWVRALTFARLILEKHYPANRMLMEVLVPRRVPGDSADIVVYQDDELKHPYIVVENKAHDQPDSKRQQWIEQLFGNANSLRAKLALYDEFGISLLFDVANFGSMERVANLKGTFDDLPEQYGEAPIYTYIAGGDSDIKPADQTMLESKIRRAHSIIWSGGKRDPLTAFDEWSKLLFAKVYDERNTPAREPRRFQIGTNDTTARVANQIHALFKLASSKDPTVFPNETDIELPDGKICEIVRTLQAISITDTAIDTIGTAFETFFGSVFRGELGQYFTMRPIARFTVAMLGLTHESFVLDPTAGSGGFLIEALLQVWHDIEARFTKYLERLKGDFAYQRLYGIEIHSILARICKINMILHQDGHAHILADRSCLDMDLPLDRLRNYRGAFNAVIGNPPFGDTVARGDEDKLGQSDLADFEVASGRSQVASEHLIIERAVEFLGDGGVLGFVVPDGLLNNQGELSNCPRMRRWLARNGVLLGIVSLPDHAFRRSGAQNKTSILFYQKFTTKEKVYFDQAYSDALKNRPEDENAAILAGLSVLDYRVFLAEANHIGYTSTGAGTQRNELYRGQLGGYIGPDQAGTILGEYRAFRQDNSYAGRTGPDCSAMHIVDLWSAHESHRLDPKYHLFKRDENFATPTGWLRTPINSVMRRIEEPAHPESAPEQSVTVMTISQTGDIRARSAGKGRNPPEWLGMYFEDSPSKWLAAKAGDVVFSSIDLWKGCIAVVPPEFDGALVTREFPIYRITDERLDPEFVSSLLRSRYYQRAFRAITTGHSNRRRTQPSDFESLEICFPPDPHEQSRLISDILDARKAQASSSAKLKEAMLRFSDLIDHRGDEEYELADLEAGEIED